MGTTVYYNDNAGNLTKRVAATGAVTQYTYDALDRVLTMTFPADSTEDVTYTYDQSGHGSGIGAACEFLKNAIAIANGALDGTIADPFDSSGGTFGFRTAGHGGPGGGYVAFTTQIPGSGNMFYGIPSLP